METETNRRKWTEDEDQRLLQQVRAFPQNLNKCFIIVAEVTGRSKGAVANRWYTKVSKDPANTCFFTASPKHISRNRKNGKGVESSRSIWQRLLNVIRNF